MIKYQYQYFPK